MENKISTDEMLNAEYRRDGYKEGEYLDLDTLSDEKIMEVFKFAFDNNEEMYKEACGCIDIYSRGSDERAGDGVRAFVEKSYGAAIVEFNDLGRFSGYFLAYQKQRKQPKPANEAKATTKPQMGEE